MDEEVEFVSEEVIQVIKSCIEATLSNTIYDKSKLNGWCNRVVEGCIKGVLKMDKPFKYVVTCIIMQKNGAGLTTTATCFWDQTSDGSCYASFVAQVLSNKLIPFCSHIFAMLA